MTHFLSTLRRERASLVYLLIALCTVLACTLRTLALFFGFDAAIGYFIEGSALSISTSLGTLLAALLCAAIPFLINIRAVPQEKEGLSTPRFLTAAAAAILTGIAALYLLICTDHVPASPMLVFLTALCWLGSAAYFLCRLLHVKLRTAAILGFFPIFAAALSLSLTYFDRYTQMNAPHKISMHLCMLAVMFAALYELRALLSRAMPRACTFVTALAASLCTVYSLSNTIAFLGGVYNDPTYLVFDLAALGFAAYFIAKCLPVAAVRRAEETEVEQ